MREQYRVRVLAYCLMDNHYHLLIKTPDGNISRAIQGRPGCNSLAPFCSVQGQVEFAKSVA